MSDVKVVLTYSHVNRNKFSGCFCDFSPLLHTYGLGYGDFINPSNFQPFQKFLLNIYGQFSVCVCVFYSEN